MMASQRGRCALHRDLEKESIIEAQERIKLSQSTRHRRIRRQRRCSISERGGATIGINFVSFYASLALPPFDWIMLSSAAGTTIDIAYRDISSVRRTSRNLRTLQDQIRYVSSATDGLDSRSSGADFNKNGEESANEDSSLRSVGIKSTAGLVDDGLDDSSAENSDFFPLDEAGISSARAPKTNKRLSRGSSSKKGGLGYIPSLIFGLMVFTSLACSSKQGHWLAAFSTVGMVEGFVSSTATPGLAAVHSRIMLPTERASSLLFVHTPHQVRPNNVESSTKQKKRAAPEYPSSSSKDTIKTTPPKTISKSKAPKKKRRKRKQRRLTFSVMFERLKAFQKTHGHCLVAADDPDPELYKWTRSIRKNYKHQFTQQVRAKKKSDAAKPKNKISTGGGHKTRRPMLSESKVAQLQSVDFCWDVQGALWDQRYQDLAECYEIHGSDAPLSLVHAIDPGLAIWMQNQRRDYRLYLQDLPTPLTHERLELLEDLGVVEDFQTQQEAWAQHYQYLVEFDQKRGHVNVPQKYSHPVVINVVDADGEVQQRETTFALGQWCMNQRTARRRWDSLHQAQKEETEENKTPKTKKEKINKAKSKVKKNGSNSSGGSGGDARNIISAFRIRMLDALDFAWNERDTKWQHMLGRLKEYYQTHGHLKIPTGDAANQDLRNWLIFQRHYFQRQQQRHQSSPMTATRVESMEGAIPDFSWKAHQGDGGPSTKDWSNLFTAMRDKGIAPDVRPKQHWFEGVNPFSADVKSEWSEQELVDLWHQEGADDDDDDDDLGGDFKQNDFYVNWEDGETGTEETTATAVPPGWEIDELQ